MISAILNKIYFLLAPLRFFSLVGFICLRMALNFSVFAEEIRFEKDGNLLIDTNEVNDANVNGSDSLTKVQFVYENNLDSLHTLDTSLNDFQKYSIVQQSIVYKNLGNLGLAYQRLVFSQFALPGINLGIHNYDIYEFTAKSIRYYKTKSPFTELFYVNGSKNEQVLGVLHTQNINRNFNIGIEYRRLTSEGFYTRQKSDYSNFSLSTRYKSKNGRYNVIANVILNNLKIEENGGISNDSLFENTISVQKNTIDVNLDSAQHAWKGKSFFIKQDFYLGRKEILDAIPSTKQKFLIDSIDSISFIPKSRVSHSLLFEEKSIVYEDVTSMLDFYDSIYFDSSNTSDQIHYTKIENQVSWNTLSGQNSRPTLGFNIKHQYVLFNQKDPSAVIPLNGSGIDTLFNNLIIGGNLSKNNHSKYYWAIGVDYVFYGSNKDDYSASASFIKKLDDGHGSINISAVIEKRSPWLIQNIYSSNHFIWENDFDKTNLIYGKLKYNIEKRGFAIGSSFSQIKNYIYFDTFAIPQQHPNVINVFSAFIVKDFRWSKWHFNNRIVYQYVWGDSPGNSPDGLKRVVIRVPEIISKHSFYFEDYLFKKALFAQIGTDIFFNSAYYADAYMPATGQFFLQNEKKIGNYPYVDVFVNFKINRARIFFKVEHNNSGLLGNVYYMVPHYPMPDRAFKIGISWMFYD